MFETLSLSFDIMRSKVGLADWHSPAQSQDSSSRVQLRAKQSWSSLSKISGSSWPNQGTSEAPIRWLAAATPELLALLPDPF